MINANTDGPQGNISRRRFIQGVVATSATAGLVAGTSTILPSVVPLSARAFGAEQSHKLVRVLNILIPPDASMPGAGDVGVADYIDRLAVAAPHLLEHFSRVLEAIPSILVSSKEELEIVLQRLEREHSESFNVLLESTYAGYYTHPQVLSLLGWTDFEQIPDQWQPFDVTLLKPRRGRTIPSISESEPNRV